MFRIRRKESESASKELSRLDGIKGPLFTLRLIVTNGVLLIGEGLNRADLEYDAKDPIILGSNGLKK